MTAPIATITLLADRPDLAAGWAELHWREWGIGGNQPGREELSWGVNDAAQAMQRTTVPVAFLGLGPDDAVLGGVGLHQFDLAERRDRSPWIVGVAVRSDRRGEGIGQALLAALEAWAVSVGIKRLWAATETAGRAVAFYQKCGYERVEEFPAQRGGIVTVLTRRLSPVRP
ncbi:MAG: GNAT family N-acetyltransferase [Ktedonobacterales bacterium]